MPIEFRCKKCQTLLRTPDETVGRKAVCPECGMEMEVPYQSAPAPRRPCVPDEEHKSSVPPMDTTSPAEQMAIGSLIFGIMSLCFSCCCFLGLPSAIAGLVLGIKGLESRHRSLAIVGIVLSGVGLLMNLAVYVINMFCNSGAFHGQQNFP